jgi:UDP-N-acetylmuramate dehydrogenase
MIDTALFEGIPFKTNEPMKKHTTFRTGGEAELMLLPQNVEQIASAVSACGKNGIKYCVIGNGSNLLVGDKGIKDVVIKLGKDFSAIAVDGNTITVQSGALLSTVANTAYKAGLTGMEFAAGIPGSVGGALCMNAGAYGGEMKDIVKTVTVLDGGEVKTLQNAECGFVYRGSKIADDGMLVLGSTIELEKGNQADIKAMMDDFAYRRSSKQPLDKPSAGSTFKRPEGYFAGKLIEDAGLRGFSIGGAQVSEKHCGFVVNTGNATTADILALIEHIKAVVKDKFGVELECEVKLLGER